jgi:hypothetical protein
VLERNPGAKEKLVIAFEVHGTKAAGRVSRSD